jgi:hypothetical protein
MTNINEAFPSKYIKAADLMGRQISVKMDRTEYEMIGNDKKLILYFIGKERGMVLNKINANNIAGIYGDETEAWHGQEITLFEAMVDFQGKTVPAIRVRTPKPAPRVAAVEHERAPQRPVSRMTETNGQPSRQSTGADIDDTIPFAPEWR